MHQAPMRIWNEIAMSQPLSQPWVRLFRATPEQFPAMLDELVDKPLEQQGADNRVILAYRLVAPLLIENEAISAYLEETQQPTLRTSLPEVTSVNEAVILASMEYPLTQSQQKKLAQLLSKPLDRLARAAQQREAEKVPVKPGDLGNIKATLPYLLEGQQEDVLKTEARFAKPNGYGMLFTNGTGTGKPSLDLALSSAWRAKARTTS